jgi:hypothetical protein
MGSIGVLPYHRDVHDGDNTGVLSQFPRSMKYDPLSYDSDALHIGATVDALDGNKSAYEVFIT